MYRSVINYGLASGMLIIGLGPTGAEAFVAEATDERRHHRGQPRPEV